MPPPSESELDANWCHIKETLTLLQLSTAQIRSSMQDGDISISELSHSLGSISISAAEIHRLLDNEPEGLRAHAETINSEVQKSVVVCQFQDRVTQRLGHVTDALSHLGTLISSPLDSIEPDNWLRLQEDIRSSYTMDSERIMFEHIMMGASVEEALEIYQHNFEGSFDGGTLDDGTGDEIELF